MSFIKLLVNLIIFYANKHLRILIMMLILICKQFIAKIIASTKMNQISIITLLITFQDRKRFLYAVCRIRYVYKFAQIYSNIKIL